MADTIEYCLCNVDGETRERLAADSGTDADPSLDTDPDAPEIVERRCLQRCGDCYRAAVLVVDGTLETADSHAPLLSAHLEAGDR